MSTNTLVSHPFDSQLPPAPTPVGAYVPSVLHNGLLYTSGTLPMKDGSLMATGRLGDSVDLETAKACAQQAVYNALAIAKSQLGSLARIQKVIKLVGFVSSAPDFYQQPAVINAASETLVSVLGETIGTHARSAVGVAALPLNAPVELEIIFAVFE
jgi:enamine deaminase RidA (YjgF/YER057c/UK114 family)